MINYDEHKVLLIGIDGACFEYIKSLIKKGKLPLFKRMLEIGVHGNLESTIPPVTIPAWISLFTGLNPGKLGVFDHQEIDSKYDLKVVTLDKFKNANIWDILSKDYKKVGIINAPRLNKSYSINGFMICDIYPKETYFFPKNIINDINCWVTKYPENSISNYGFLKLAFKNFKKRVKVFNLLLDKKDVDFFSFTIFLTDWCGHLSNSRKMTERALILIDKELTPLINKAEKKGFSIFIVSDHGHGRSINKAFFLNTWLLKRGYLSILKDAQNIIIERIVQFLRSCLLLLPMRSLYIFFEKKIKKDIDTSYTIFQNIDWKNTKAFARGGTGTNYIGIQLNTKNNFYKGIINDVDYNILINEIINDLKKIKDKKTGIKVIEKIFLKEKLYFGENIKLLPDLIIKTKDNFKTIASLSPNIICRDKDFAHTEFGIFIAYGKHIKKGYKIKNAKIFDIYPTILYYLNVSIPLNIDGKILNNMFEYSFISNKIPKYQKSIKINEINEISKDDEKKIIKKLKALGYIQ